RAERYAAQGNPQFSDPQLQAVVKDFEARYAVIGVDADQLGLDQGRPCPVSKATAFTVMKGMSYEAYQEMQLDVAAKVPGYTGISDPDAVRMVSLSGVCGETGPQGPAVIVGTSRDISRYRGEGYSTVTVSDTVGRIEATWAEGQRRGAQTIISITRSAQFNETGDGQLAESIDDWDYINEIREAPTAVYMYVVPKTDGTPRYTVSFARNPTVGTYTTTVTEHLDARLTYARTWQGTELLQESRMRDGQLHGWMIIHPTVYDGTQIPGRRDCYQGGALVKALACPSN
ncbi:MAG: hypothetical protein RLN99_01005, partial [Kiloniellaceae bacterium]